MIINFNMIILIWIVFVGFYCINASEEHDESMDYWVSSQFDWSRQKAAWKREETRSYLRSAERFIGDGHSKRTFPVWSSSGVFAFHLSPSKRNKGIIYFQFDYQYFFYFIFHFIH